MRATITIVCDVDTVQRLTALRQKCHEYVEHEGVSVIASNSGFDDQPFTVTGSIKGKPEESWLETVLATDAEDAKVKVAKVDAKRTIVAVFKGELHAV